MSKPERSRTESTRGRAPSGQAQTAAERMRRHRARQRAAGLRVVAWLEPLPKMLSGGALKHRIIEARGLAMHCLAAQKIERSPSLPEQVRQALES